MPLQEVQARLRSAGIENARWEAQLLTDALQGEALQAAVERRCTGYPLQYLLGEWYFWRECYEVNEHCLIPRSDTELLVECAVRELPQGAHFLDLCTGSGCVAVSTLCSRPDTKAVGLDLFEKTLRLAERNGKRNGVADRLTLTLADVLQPPPVTLAPGSFDAILSNPPYIRGDVIPTLQKEVQYEPVAALFGGEDGLDFYRAILHHWTELLAPDGVILLEIGYDQADALRALGEEKGFSCTVYRDLGGNDRVVRFRR